VCEHFPGGELLWAENEESRNLSRIMAKVKKRKRHKHEEGGKHPLSIY